MILRQLVTWNLLKYTIRDKANASSAEITAKKSLFKNFQFNPSKFIPLHV